MNGEKFCNGCLRWLPIDHFSISRANLRDGRQPRCKTCQRAYREMNAADIARVEQAYRRLNAVSIRQKKAARYQDSKRQGLAHKLKEITR